MDTLLSTAIRKCPFLHNLAQTEGPELAAHIATRPTQSFKSGAGPIFEEATTDFAATFRLFHGPGGLVPLKRFEESPASTATRQANDFAVGPYSGVVAEQQPAPRRERVVHPLAASAASISLSAGFLVGALRLWSLSSYYQGPCQGSCPCELWQTRPQHAVCLFYPKCILTLSGIPLACFLGEWSSPTILL
jgi:hypothetical protein